MGVNRVLNTKICLKRVTEEEFRDILLPENGYYRVKDVYMNMDLSSTYTMNQWNYQETVTTQYIPETMVCQKCTTIKDCLDPRRPWVGTPHCKKWAKPKQECTEIQF